MNKKELESRLKYAEATSLQRATALNLPEELLNEFADLYHAAIDKKIMNLQSDYYKTDAAGKREFEDKIGLKIMGKLLMKYNIKE